MPSFEGRLSQLEVLVSEILTKQDEHGAQIQRLESRTRQMNATMLNRFADHDARFDRLEARFDQLESKVEQHGRLMQHGFDKVNQRLTDLFTLLSIKPQS